MLSYMRKNANSTVAWFIIGAIAVVFVFFGVGPGGGVGGGSSIRVNGQDVSNVDYGQALEAVNQTLVARGLADTDNFQNIVREVAVEEVVSLYLTRQFTQKMGLTPSDRSVALAIAEIPQFQTDGRFDPARYKDVLRAMRITAANFEQGQRDEIGFERLGLLIEGLAQVQKSEALAYFHLQQDRVEFDYAFFPTSVHRPGLVPTDEALDAYYARNQRRWLRPAELDIEYVLLRPADFLDKVVLEEPELRQYYEQNSQRFTRPESAEVSHILFRFPDLEPGPEQREQVLEKARQAYQRSQEEDFAALARELSEDPDSAPLGGALGSLNRGMGFMELDEVIFSIPVNQVSQPVETLLGYHLLKVTTRREAGVRPFEEVREILAEERRAMAARALAVAKLEDLIVRSETSELAEAAASMGLTTAREILIENVVPVFFEGDVEAVKQAFSAPLERVADPVEMEENFTLYVPLAHRPDRIPALDEVRSEVIEAWIADEATGLARQQALDFARLGSETGWAEALETIPPATVKTGRTPLAPRTVLGTEALFKNADSRQFLASIFSVAKVGEVSPVAVNGQMEGSGDGVFALALVRFVPADESLFKGPTPMMSTQKANLLYRVWRTELRREATITVPRQYL